MKLSDARLAELEARWKPVGNVVVSGAEFVALLAEVRSSRAALARIERAYNDPGQYPPLHERVKGFTRRDWPTLTAAIEAAIGKENHGR